jgi:hypothetical protein
MDNHGYAGANPHVGYAASRISFSLNGRTNKFGWLQASASKVSLLQSLAQTLQPSEFVILVVKGYLDFVSSELDYWDLAGLRGDCSLTGDLVWRSL